MVLYFKGRLPAGTVFSLPQNMLNPTVDEYMEVGPGMLPEALLACVAPAAGFGVELTLAHRSECLYKARFFFNQKENNWQSRALKTKSTLRTTKQKQYA